MNKILKGLVAVAATAAMSVAGFAGASAAMAVTTGSYTITVNEKNDKHTFNAYQVFKGDLKESQNEQDGVTPRASATLSGDPVSAKLVKPHCTTGRVSLLMQTRPLPRLLKN